MTKLLFICGSLREASSSRGTIRALQAALAGKCDTEIAEVGDLPHYNADIEHNDAVEAFKAAIAAADGVVFVTPEYNYSIPGVLKNAIDWASRPAFQSVFKDKPCFVISVSGGALGGVRAQAHLKSILGGMLARVFPWQEVVVTSANAAMKDGVLDKPEVIEFAVSALDAMIAEID